MNKMKTERFDYIYLLFGIFCGFLLGSSFNQESSVVIKKVIIAFAIIFIAVFYGKLEAKSHRHHLNTWEKIRASGKWSFILTRYILLRGIILSVILIGPVISALQLSSVILWILIFCLIPLFGYMMYQGYEEWKDCEQEIHIASLRQVAEFITSKNN
jgi:hypothetical protein